MVSILCGLTACRNSFGNTVGDEFLVKMITAFEYQDLDTVKSLFLPNIVEYEGFNDGLEMILSYYTGYMTSWERTSQHTTRLRGREGDTSTTVSVYQVTTNDDTFRIRQTHRELPSGESGIIAFNIVRAEELAQSQRVGHLSDWRVFNFYHWAILLLNILAYIFILVTLIHCIKNKLRRKALLILLILVQSGFSIIQSSVVFRVNFTFLTIFSRSILLVSTDGFELLFLLPLGAIVYWIIYKRFKEADIQSVESLSSTELEKKSI